MVTVGKRTKVAPVPLVIPPQETEYHFQYAPSPKMPPDKLIVVDEPVQINDGEEEAELAADEFVHTKTVVLMQSVVLQVPSALIKYNVLIVGVTTSDVPFPEKVPPQLPEYQYH